MTEKILFVPGANGTELTRMLARFNKNTLGMRVMNATEFARFALMRSGIVLTENFLPRKQEPALIDSFVKDVPYFSSAVYADSEKIADALFKMRTLIPENESETIAEKLPGGEFQEKNEGLFQVYENYLAALKKQKSIDTIGLLRKAIREAMPLSCRVYTLAEYPLTPLESALVDSLASPRIDSCLAELLTIDPTGLRNLDYTESYGSANEVEAIYEYIVAHDLPFDQCIIAVTATAHYSQLFYDFAQKHHLPLTLGCGIPILNAAPARLLKQMHAWSTTGYFGKDALRDFLQSDALNQKKLWEALSITSKGQFAEIINLAGQLRLNCNRVENAVKIDALPRNHKQAPLYPNVVALAGELELGVSQFIARYGLIRTGDSERLDRSALAVICDTLDAYTKYTEGDVNQIIPELLQKSVCSENSREGALFVTGLSGTMASLRKHLFIAGMAASHFPGTPKENYLLLDSDYPLFADPATAPTSTNLIARKRQGLDQLLSLASTLGVHTHISYSSYDPASLKVENPSSVLFELFKQQNGGNATMEQYKKAFRQVGYFDQRVSGDYTIGRAYVQGKEVIGTGADRTEAPCAYTKDRSYSPSTLSIFFDCPRRFFLTSILGIKEQDQDDPFSVIDGANVGTLAHDLMEEFARNRCNRDTFLQRAGAAFDRFLLTRPAMHPDIAVRERAEFCKMMATAFDNDPGNTVLKAEEEQYFRHSSGVLLHGYPDRVEVTGDGQFIIADYKTGRNVKHIENDIDTCLQVVIYAYLMEQKGTPISYCEYRYLRDGITIPCRYDADMKAKLDAKMCAFKEALDAGNFPLADKEDACKYCTLGNICGKNAKTDEEAESE